MGLTKKLAALFGQRRAGRHPPVIGETGGFFQAGGNSLLWTDLPLDENDVVIDAGGFQGEWTAEILKRYGCRAIVFEPGPQMAADLRKLFGHNRRVEIIEAGVGAKDSLGLLHLQDNESSFLRSDIAGQVAEVKIFGVADFLKQRNLTDVGCFKINIEGGEYDLLDELIARGCATCVRSLLVQFHTIVDHGVERRQEIQRQLERTHEKLFDFPFVWEKWVRRN
jgi:FkbM family methyltransferase